MEILGKLQVYRVDETRKGEWVQCRSLVTMQDGAVYAMTVLREKAKALAVGQYTVKLALRERDGNLSLEPVSLSPVEVRKAA